MIGFSPFRGLGLAEALVSLMALFATVAVGSWVHYQRVQYLDALQDAENTTRDLTFILEEHAKRTVDAADLVLLRVIDRIGGSDLDQFGRSAANRSAVSAMADRLAQVGTITVVDAEGDSVMSTIPDAKPINLADRDYFKAHRDGADFVIGPAVAGRVTGKRVFTITRRIATEDGRFAGVAVAGIYTAYFEGAYRGILADSSTMTAIIGDKGPILVRPGPSDEELGTSPAGTTLFAHLAKAPSGTYQTQGAFDDKGKVVSYRRVTNLPLVVTASIPREAALHEWHDRMVFSGTFTALAIAALAALTVVAVQRMRQERKATADLHQAKESLEEKVAQRTADLQAANLSIERNARFFDAILSASPDMVFLLDPAMRFTFVNKAAARIRPGRTDWIGGCWRDLGFPAATFEPLEAEARAVFADGRSRTIESDLPGGPAPHSFEYKLIAVPGDDGGPAAVLCVARDITERRRTEEILRRTKMEAERANLSKTQFLAAASHDLRQPVQAQRLFQHLLEATLTTPKQKEIAAYMAKSLEASESLLSTLMDVSALESGAIQPSISTVTLGDIIGRVANDSRGEAEAKGLTFRVRGGHCRVTSDPVLLERMVRNLVANALRYTTAGKVLLACRHRADHVLLQVWDTGPGIPPDKISMIFEDFYQIGNPERDRAKGLGLGLAVVARMARLLDHQIDVRSTPGRGTVFTVKLPRPVDEGPGPGPGPGVRVGDGRADLRGLVVLAVEDDGMQLDAITLLLEDAGARVIGLPTGEAIEDKLAAEPSPPDIILSDYRLPGHVNGLEAVERVRRYLGKNLPAILQTGDVDPLLAEAVRSRSCVLLHKPYDPKRLTEIIREMV